MVRDLDTLQSKFGAHANICDLGQLADCFAAEC